MAVDQTLVAQGKCGGKLRNKDAHCKNVAGKKTSHLGTGRCWLHGAADGAGAPIKHGRYSKVKSPRLQELIKEFEKDPDPLNLLPEVQLLRALILDYIERYDEYAPALIAWYASFSREYKAQIEVAEAAGEDPPPPVGSGKPHQVADILAVGTFIASLGALVERIEKRRDRATFSMGTVVKLAEDHAAVAFDAVRELVNDRDLQTRLFQVMETGFSNIKLDQRAGTSA